MPASASTTAARPTRPNFRRSTIGVLVAMGAACAVQPALAQCFVTNLHPAAGMASRATWVLGDTQYGWTTLDPVPGHGRHAGTWNGAQDTWTDLNPAFSGGGSRIYASDGVQHAGVAFVEPAHVAVLWDAPTGTSINLNPEGFLWSVATGVHNSQQSGWVYDAGARHAVMWSSTPESFRQLHPEAAESSEALGIHSGTQVGWARFESQVHAGLWTGSSESWRSLHPTGADSSEAKGVHGTTQVGFADFAGVTHAGLWNGSADSWVDLHPEFTDGPSQALGVFGDLQVGFAGVDGYSHAALWNGSADSWLDLHSVLDCEIVSSAASGVWSDGSITYVTGWGFNTSTGREEALMWTIPSPGAAVPMLAAAMVAVASRRRRG